MTVQTDPYTFSNGTTADALEVNARFNPLYTLQNAAIDSTNMNMAATYAWTGLHTHTTTSTTQTLLTVTGSSLTTGSLASYISNSADTTARNLFKITNDNTLATGAKCLFLQQDAIQAAMVIQNVSASGQTALTDSTLVLDSGRDNLYLSFLSLDAKNQGIVFGDASANYRGQVQYNHSSDVLSLHASANEVLRITCASSVSVSTLTGVSTNSDAFYVTGNSDQSRFLSLYGGRTGNSYAAIFWDDDNTHLTLGPATATTGAGLVERFRFTTTGEMRFYDPDVAHGITTHVETSCFAQLAILNGTDGGYALLGYRDNASGPVVQIGGTSNGNPTTNAVLQFTAAKKSGTGRTNLADSEYALELVKNDGTVTNRWIGDGGQFFHNSSVAHGITDEAPTDAYGKLTYVNSSNGGLRIFGFTDTANGTAIQLFGFSNGNPTTTAPVRIASAKRSGTGLAVLASSEYHTEFITHTGSALVRILGDGSTNILTGDLTATTGNIIATAGDLLLNDASGGFVYFGGSLSSIGGNASLTCFINNTTSETFTFTTATSPLRQPLIISHSAIYPNGDNAVSCGKTGQRWSEVWAANGTIQTSDLKLKKDVNKCEYGLDFINKLNPVSYKWNNGSDQEREHYGFIAQEVMPLLDKLNGLCRVDNNEHSICYTELIAPIVAAIKELDKKINSFEAEFLYAR